MDKPAQWALVGAAWFLAISVAVVGFLALERLGPAHPEAAAAGVSVQDAGAVLCPVTGKRIIVGPDTPKVIYLGKTYYFSDDRDADGVDARSRFLMDPESYLKRQPPAAGP
jgi:YHS domain-containing protein